MSLCAVGPVEGEQSEVLQECPSEWPLALSSSLRSSPVGPAVCLCDIFICRTAMPPQRDWTVCERWAMTLSLAILSQKSCQGKCAVRLSFFTHPPLSSLHHPTPVFLVRSISGHTTLCSPETLLLFFLCFVLLTLIIAVLHLLHNPPCFAYRAALLRECNRFQRPADAPKLYLLGRGGLSSTVCRLICRWHCVICQH